MNYASINFAGNFSQFSDHWSPRINARMNDCDFKLVKFQGEFVWHQHDAGSPIRAAGCAALRRDRAPPRGGTKGAIWPPFPWYNQKRR